MCEFNKCKNELLWCTPMNAPCIKCVDKYPKIYEKIKKIVKEHERSNVKMLENRWGIIGFDHDNAESIMNNIEATSGKIIKQRIRGGREMYTLFTDGTFVKWIDPDNCPRAQRFGKIWCNIHVNKNVFEQVIMPMYRGKMEDIIWL